jgi:hypothetical protein
MSKQLDETLAELCEPSAPGAPRRAPPAIAVTPMALAEAEQRATLMEQALQLALEIDVDDHVLRRQAVEQLVRLVGLAAVEGNKLALRELERLPQLRPWLGAHLGDTDRAALVRILGSRIASRALRAMFENWLADAVGDVHRAEELRP